MYNCVNIYLDESGDLGFNLTNSSKNLVMAAMATADDRDLSRLPKRVRRKLNISGMDKEIKFSNSSSIIRDYFLEHINVSECWIVWGAVNKRKMENKFGRDRRALYNYLCSKVLCDMFKSVHSKNINLFIDRSPMKPGQRDELDRLIHEVLKENHSGNFQPKLIVRHLDSLNCQCLQTLDFIVGSIYQSVEHSNDRYVDQISEKIIGGQLY